MINGVLKRIVRSSKRSNGTPVNGQNHSSLNGQHAPIFEQQAPSFDAQLVPQLKAANERMKDQFRQIEKALQERQYHRIPKLLRKFWSIMVPSAYTECERLNTYVAIACNGGGANQLQRTFRQESDRCGARVNRFVTKYKEIDNAEVFARPSFLAEFSLAHEAFTKRNKIREEVIFPLYSKECSLKEIFDKSNEVGRKPEIIEL